MKARLKYLNKVHLKIRTYEQMRSMKSKLKFFYLCLPDRINFVFVSVDIFNNTTRLKL